MATIISDLLKEKSNQIWSVDPNDTVYHALQLMAEKNIGALLVIENDQVVGIFSERDYARKGILKGKASKDTPVSEMMTTRVYFVKPDQAIQDCLTLFTDKRIRHLPVIEGEKILGVVSIGDVVKGIISYQESAIQQLEEYITGRR